MAEWLRDIADIFVSIGSFLEMLVVGAVDFFSIVPDLLGLVTDAAAYTPSILLPFIMYGLMIALLYMIFRLV